MPKKGENIYKRKDGRWEGRYIKARVDNKAKYGYVYGRKYSDVKEKLTILKANHLHVRKSFNLYYVTFGDWICQWMNEEVKKSVKPTTYSKYLHLVHRFILPELGDLRLHKIDKNTLQNFIYVLQSKPLAASSIKNIFILVKKALIQAEAAGNISKNPATAVVLPKGQAKRVRSLSVKEQRALEMQAFQEKGCSAVILALYTGMRIGEISGLTWSDIDFEENLVYVNRTISRITDMDSSEKRTKLFVGTPKTSQSSRIIPLPANLRRYLLEKRMEEQGEYLISCRGKLAEPRVIGYRFSKLLKEAKLPAIPFHALRHTFATRCLEQGVDIASLSRLLGHASIKMTLDTYTDSMMEKRISAMDELDRTLHYQCK
ncbi:site-specific integrase [Enterococcus sp. BWB1-3]|uniref:tyrosine-type recombinase/integrase n=1 Tax=unclassified Enterococcus TaxID=2608891 RepID=UPI0019223CE9|nr:MULTISPECIES: site-specific integrase [unclassified Enterococcus]MBL1230308.1 site-specific integrase [Enterococcus sp. BWB1-3]MCB5951349.1 site-specific integrase [Enterococcus sp. BWT-B8]MCB5956358.1 site-specific integrase [Enterococcus sp. CWB-B31]